MTLKRRLLFSVFATFAALPSASAQDWGHSRSPRDGACFYKDPNFDGEYFCIASGDEYRTLPEDMNDKISSIRVFGRAEVYVYQDVRFEGRSSRFEVDVRNLKNEGWNDKISSIRVKSYGRASGMRPEEAERIVRRAYEDVLDRAPDSSGMRLYRSRIIDEGWTEAQVRQSLRESPEFREKNSMTQQKAQDIVRRAYQNVLRREPDAGARPFVDRVMHDHWTQSDVERELRKSPEYRSKG